MKYKKITDFPVNQKNPFFHELLEIKTGRKNIIAGNADEVIVSTKDGSVKGHTAHMRYKEVDKEQFVKFFIDDITTFWGLSQKSMRVFTFIVSHLKPNLDFIYIDTKECMSYTGYSTRATITSALAELVELRFISRSPRKHWWFINPTIFFNGDRISFIKSYKLIDKKELK